jgi:hypothetical protein
MKHDSLIAGGVLDGDAMWLLECVPKIVTMLVLEQVLCVALRQCAKAPQTSLAAGLGLDTLALPP